MFNSLQTSKKKWILASAIALVCLVLFWKQGEKVKEDTLYSIAKERSFAIEVHTAGEIDAGHSTTISSSLRGDIAKLIELIPDGTKVVTGDIIAKVDSTPFEEKVAEIQLKIQDQELKVKGLQQGLEREKNQASHEMECVEFEIESCELELDKIKNGEGPFEISRLNAQLSKARAKYEELQDYQKELEKLAKVCSLPPGEEAQCQRQLQQEKEAFEQAEQQYMNYVKFVFPASVKKAEVSLQKALSNKRELENVGAYRVATAKLALDQAEQYLLALKKQYQMAEAELAKTTLVAPSPGIVVHRSEFRNGSKRKPQLGDLLMKNQPLLEIPDLSSMVVNTKIREMDLHKVQMGQSTSVEIDAFPGKIFSGEVIYLGTLAKRDQIHGFNEKAFEMVVRLIDKDTRLRPGMTARVTVHSAVVDEQLTIPSHSVFIADNKFYCYLLTKNGYEKREIKITPASDQWVLVWEGLSEGNKILLTKPLD